MTRPNRNKSRPNSTARADRQARVFKRPTGRFVSTAPGTDTKHARIIAMLRKPAGVTIAAIMTATRWQQHSARGFLAGVVRKKLGLNLVSERTSKGRVYRSIDDMVPPAKMKQEDAARCVLPVFSSEAWPIAGSSNNG